jgi:hypothetical protein
MIWMTRRRPCNLPHLTIPRSIFGWPRRKRSFLPNKRIIHARDDDISLQRLSHTRTPGDFFSLSWLSACFWISMMI